MGHVYVRALMEGNEGCHEEQNILLDSAVIYSFWPLRVIEKTGAARSFRKGKIRSGDRNIM